MAEPDRALPPEAVAALQRGSKIQAIKRVRMAHGVGLKEAKDIVERFIDENPAVKSRMHAANRQDAKRGFGWLLAIVAIATAAYYFLVGKP